MTTPPATSPSVQVASGHARPPRVLVERFRRMAASTVADAQQRLWVLDGGIGPMWAGAACVGPALPVYTRAGDNLAVHHALDLAEPGDVLVVNGQGDTTRALVGELLAARAFRAGLAGVVVDGAVRDVHAFSAIGLPVFARGATPAGPYKHGPAEIGYPVACGGVVCAPGDIVCGDADGVVVVPQARAEQVAERADAVVRHERELARTWASVEPDGHPGVG
jgi:regulator of RNase E activity RraA